MHDRILLPFAFVLALVGAPSQASPLLQLTPSSQTIALDTPLLIGVHIAGLGDGVALGGYDLTVGFDTTLLSFRNALFGDPVLGDQLDLDHSGTQRPSAAVNNPGRLDLLELSLDAASLLRQEQANQFLLATLGFRECCVRDRAGPTNRDPAGERPVALGLHDPLAH
ncbi:MAG: hypothetical protein H6R26_2976 [Proteobacteria bacterium]|nr:hypothetical protein [Pseudomonadota bacterium]